MIVRIFQGLTLPRAAAAAALLALGAGLAGCAGMGDSMSTAFADPAKYELYDCKQLEAERKSLANRAAENGGPDGEGPDRRRRSGGGRDSPIATKPSRSRARGNSPRRPGSSNKCRPSPPATAATPAAPSANAARATPQPKRPWCAAALAFGQRGLLARFYHQYGNSTRLGAANGLLLL